MAHAEADLASGGGGDCGGERGGSSGGWTSAVPAQTSIDERSSSPRNSP